MLIEDIAIDFDILDDAIEQCLPGYSGRGWVNFKPDRSTKVRTVYRLSQTELGDVGCVTVIKRREKVSAIHITEPKTPSKEEIMDYAAHQDAEVAERVRRFIKDSSNYPPAEVRAMVGFGLLAAESIEWLPPNPEHPLGSWRLNAQEPAYQILHEADRKIDEWRKRLTGARKAHHEQVMDALFGRLYGEDIWPERLLFSGKSKDLEQVIRSTRLIVERLLPVGNKDQRLHSGSVEPGTETPRKVYIFAHLSGVGQVAVGYLIASPFPDIAGFYEITCYAKDIGGVLDSTHAMFGELRRILLESSLETSGLAPDNRSSYPTGSTIPMTSDSQSSPDFQAVTRWATPGASAGNLPNGEPVAYFEPNKHPEHVTAAIFSLLGLGAPQTSSNDTPPKKRPSSPGLPTTHLAIELMEVHTRLMTNGERATRDRVAAEMPDNKDGKKYSRPTIKKWVDAMRSNPHWKAEIKNRGLWDFMK